MTPYDFKNSWTNIAEPLSAFKRTRLDRFNLQDFTIEFLVNAGLPLYCEPNLSFAKDIDDVYYGVNKLTEQYDFEKSELESFSKYIVIGSCRDGDPIAIDTKNNDRIVELDHEDLFTVKYFNSSINSLAKFLILYRDFEKDVLLNKDETDNFQIYNFTDDQIEGLKQNMSIIDKDAITEDGFWKDEFEIMTSLRKEHYEKAKH